MAGVITHQGLNQVSSRDLKERIRDLGAEEALDAVRDLRPTRYYYKDDGSDERLGFIAEDLPELLRVKDGKAVDVMDVVAVLTKVVQRQQKEIDELRRRGNCRQ